MGGTTLPLPQYALMARCSLKKHRDNFSFHLFLLIAETHTPGRCVSDKRSMASRFIHSATIQSNSVAEVLIRSACIYKFLKYINLSLCLTKHHAMKMCSLRNWAPRHEVLFGKWRCSSTY